jgi:hypothetical protein
MEKEKYCLVKRTELEKEGFGVVYYTTLNGSYVVNSKFSTQEEAELFFDKLLELNGKHIVIEVLKEKEI